MKRIQIRNMRSKKNNKPRVFDAIIDDEDNVSLEIKNGPYMEVIPLLDVLTQIRDKMELEL